MLRARKYINAKKMYVISLILKKLRNTDTNLLLNIHNNCRMNLFIENINNVKLFTYYIIIV